MAPPKQQPPERITVDGVDYIWSVRRAPQFSAKHGWVGLVITVEPAERPQRVLVIEYPMPKDWTPAGPMARRIARPPSAPSRHARRPGAAGAAHRPAPARWRGRAWVARSR